MKSKFPNSLTIPEEKPIMSKENKEFALMGFIVGIIVGFLINYAIQLKEINETARTTNSRND